MSTHHCALPNTPLAQAAEGLDACVHCGFCLPACPTYVTLHDENDSPRGRIVLMQQLLAGTLPLTDPDVGDHLDRCLGCRACETACPSGVPYGQLLEATRATMHAARAMPRVARLTLALFSRPTLLAVVLFAARLFRGTRLPAWLARLLPRRIAFPMAMLASTAPASFSCLAIPPTRLAATRSLALPQLDDESRAATNHAVLLEGCVMRGLFAHTNRATARVVEASGFQLRAAPEQRCCGALHAHAGDLDGARALARHNIAAFESTGEATIVVNSAGCGAMLKEYGHLLQADAVWATRAQAVAERVRDVSEVVANGMLAPSLTERGAHGARTVELVRVAYDPPCHLLHAQRISKEPMMLLRGIPGIALVPLQDADQCCGSAGIYNLIEPEVSEAVLAPKLEAIRTTRTQFVATGNPGCLMQLGAGLLLNGSETRAVHPVELLDAVLEQPSPDQYR